MITIARVADIRWAVDGPELYKARMMAGLNQTQLAEMCGWTTSFISGLENGAYNTVRGEIVKRLCAAFEHTELDVGVSQD